MAARARKNIYDQSVRITYAYLGPAARRFVNRQARNHLNKDPEKMTAKDLGKLIEWIRLAVSLLTDDKLIVDEYIGRLELLVNGTHTKS